MKSLKRNGLVMLYYKNFCNREKIDFPLHVISFQEEQDGSYLKLPQEIIDVYENNFKKLEEINDKDNGIS